MTDFLAVIVGDFYARMLVLLLSATQWTIYLSLTAFVGGGLIGLAMTLLRIAPVKWARLFSAAYIWTFQSVPLLMLLFLIGLGMPAFFKVNVPPWAAATTALTLFTSAYMSEVWRGAIQSVPAGQWEAGRVLGLTFAQSLRYVVSPQAIKIAIPPTVGFMVQIIKGTSLAYIIDFNDLMRWGKKIGNSQLDGAEPFVVFPIVAAIYFLLCYPLTVLSRRLERRSGGEKLMVAAKGVNVGG